MYQESNADFLPSIIDRWSEERPASHLEEMTFHWINKNPDAFMFLLDISEMALTIRGYKKWSIAGAVEIIRWDHPEIITGKGGFHLSNSYRATLARMINTYLGTRFFVTRDNEGHIRDY